MLNSTIWDREVICPTAVDILIIVTRRSFVWHATLRSRECIQLGPFRLRWFEFELFLEMYLHTVNDFFFVLLIVLYDRVYPLKRLLSSLCFSCSNSARLSRLSSCNFIVIKYSFSDAFLLIWRWKLYVCDWFFANERHRPSHSYDVLLFFILCLFQTIQTKSNALFTLWEIGLWCLYGWFDRRTQFLLTILRYNIQIFFERRREFVHLFFVYIGTYLNFRSNKSPFSIRRSVLQGLFLCHNFLKPFLWNS